MRLLLIRHGQTPANVIGSLDTTIPGPGLTELGYEQAAAVPGALAGERIDAIYASVQVRSQLTAEPLVRERGLPLQVRPGIREISSGHLEGNTDVESQEFYLSTMVAWVEGDFAREIPGGESAADVFARYNEVIGEAYEAGQSSIAMVSHGAVIRTWAGYHAHNLGAQFVARTPLHNTGIVVVEGSPEHGWSAVSYMGEAVGGLALDDGTNAGPASRTQ
ncbi:putative phosphoglycerate mutase [Glaciihabitans tibetensis]|uniref:Putative phosphoglycerate mutase n=1 Tax=Glaciihabitans tibetensis TaxID=1266600 RepID=A0A2T0V1M3_9MICO|nr:histidine phosphatase family protein [Glaciihabitans tibetensis]PRY64070.1 putative phosphoglycerate mutase [Glaciihabitans tibetensis]